MPPEPMGGKDVGAPAEGWNLVLYRLDQIERKMDGLITDDRLWRTDYDKRLSVMNDKQNQIEVTLGRLGERLNVFAAIQTAFTAIAATAAAAFGRLSR